MSLPATSGDTRNTKYEISDKTSGYIYARLSKQCMAHIKQLPKAMIILEN